MSSLSYAGEARSPLATSIRARAPEGQVSTNDGGAAILPTMAALDKPHAGS